MGRARAEVKWAGGRHTTFPHESLKGCSPKADAIAEPHGAWAPS